MTLEQLGMGDLLGVAGFLVYALADTLLALRRLHSDQIRFYVIYACAGALILASLTIDFNLGAALSEAFTLLTCMVAIALRMVRPVASSVAQPAKTPARSPLPIAPVVRSCETGAPT